MAGAVVEHQASQRRVECNEPAVAAGHHCGPLPRWARWSGRATGTPSTRVRQVPGRQFHQRGDAVSRSGGAEIMIAPRNYQGIPSRCRPSIDTQPGRSSVFTIHGGHRRMMSNAACLRQTPERETYPRRRWPACCTIVSSTKDKRYAEHVASGASTSQLRRSAIPSGTPTAR